MKRDTPDPGQSDGDPSEVRDRLMERVRSGDPSEQDAAIAALIERVRLSKSGPTCPSSPGRCSRHGDSTMQLEFWTS